MLNRVSLNTIGLNRIGLNRIGKPSRGSFERPYIDPEVLASLKAVCICYGKSNDDPDRAIIKNLVDPDNPFVISNAAYEGMSGHNGYPVVFGANKTWKQLPTYNSIYSINGNKIHITKVLGANRGLIFSYVKQNDQLYDITEIPSFKIRVSGLKGDSKLRYSYIKTENAVYQTLLDLDNGIHKLPKSLRPTDSIINGSWIGFTITPIVENEITFDCDITIEVLPEYEGAFVTDGVEDLITSTKTVQEMLGGSNEITVVSMIHQVKDSANNVSFTNYIRGSANGYFRNIVNNYDKTGIYGYTSSDLMGLSVVNNILGDKNDYTSNGDNRDSIINGNFSVQGYSYNDGNNTGDFSSVAWYWTIIANKVLTTDQINQVIAYFNLDKTLKPDILCNTIKQGITNENHAEFGDKLIDFSGNGRDIQLNNLAWKGDSGIGKYNFSNINTIASNRFEGAVTTNKCHFTKKLTNTTNNFCDLVVISPNEPIKFKVSGLSDGRKLFVANKSGSGSNYNFDNGEHEVSLSFAEGVGQNNPFGVTGDIGDIDVTVEFIPSHAGALCLDGVNDFGKVTGMPIYKDYTVVADYIRTSAKENAQDSPILSKSQVVNNGAFVFNYLNTNSVLNSYSFGINNGLESISDSERKIYYQSKYVNDGKSINSGTGTDYNSMWLGTYRDNVQIFFNGAIYSLMSFPYSMSEFLIERQLKKHKLGALYPDMVEFRPIVKSNLPYSSISYSVNPGEYISVDSMVTITVTLPNTSDKLMEVSCNAISDISISGDNGVYEITGKIVKSPQKINLVISSYLTMLSNSTLISNETLIKNE